MVRIFKIPSEAPLSELEEAKEFNLPKGFGPD
jgi:hypothetical protein